MKNWDLLYITYIDMEEPATTGSSVRPIRFWEAFRQLGISVKLLEGANNRGAIRKRNCREILTWMEDNHPRLCYVELPSGPIFHTIDYKVMKKLKEQGTTIGVFYRDIYWRFPIRDFEEGGKSHLSLTAQLKHRVVQYLQRRDLRFFQKTVDLFFVPSRRVAELAGFTESFVPLPPAGKEVEKGGAYEKDCQRIQGGDRLVFLYVGNVSERYGTSLMMDAMQGLNRDRIQAELILVCPPGRWEETGYAAKYGKSSSWLHLEQAAPGHGLEELYAKADLCLLPLRKTPYNDLAVSVKLFEYASYCKPILATNLDVMGKIVGEAEIGWVSPDVVPAYQERLRHIVNNRQELLEKKARVKAFARRNTWRERAKEVLAYLEREQKTATEENGEEE